MIAIATLIGALHQLTHLPKGSVVFDPTLGNWVLAFTVISLALQMGATGLVAWRIWETINWRERCSWTHEWHALRIIVESGAMYGVLTVLSLAFYLDRTDIGGFNVGIVTQASVSLGLLLLWLLFDGTDDHVCVSRQLVHSSSSFERMRIGKMKRENIK